MRGLFFYVDCGVSFRNVFCRRWYKRQLKLMRILLLFLLISVSAHAQQPTYDSVDYKRVRVNNLSIGSKKAELERKFGLPQKIVTTEAQKGTDLYSDYYYGKSTLRVSPAGVFNGFKLMDPEFILGVGTRVIKTGASLKEFALYFPTSFREYAKNNNGRFRIKIKTGHTFIILKTKDGIVKEIETHDEPSY